MRVLALKAWRALWTCTSAGMLRYRWDPNFVQRVREPVWPCWQCCWSYCLHQPGGWGTRTVAWQSSCSSCSPSTILTAGGGKRWPWWQTRLHLHRSSGSTGPAVYARAGRGGVERGGGGGGGGGGGSIYSWPTSDGVQTYESAGSYAPVYAFYAGPTTATATPPAGVSLDSDNYVLNISA